MENASLVEKLDYDYLRAPLVRDDQSQLLLCDVLFVFSCHYISSKAARYRISQIKRTLGLVDISAKYVTYIGTSHQCSHASQES